jgi:excisionase family DNA binding protein
MHSMHTKQFISPAQVAGELDVSTATVLRLIHAGALPAIRVSERIYRIPIASFEMYKAGTLRDEQAVRLHQVKKQPRLGEGEALPKPRPTAVAVGR